MFGWGRKKPTQPPLLTAEMQQALDMGKRPGDDLIADVERYFAERYEPVFERYLGVLRAGIQAGLVSPDAPPIWKAPTEFNIFTENVWVLK